ncbi:predicted protein [Nematostella vectensis]|uniref:ALOG domain-containing protein n=1 Tax=Nematostella vectensis TaxID=45351 RepID=A7SVA9_NEMVE|nr:predicted protein [Nematostella vectensis]|eukprot:XP_001624459.1 predicted protein [Nematostella vectensis]
MPNKRLLRRELEEFLEALPGYVSIATVTPRDICRFLVSKDKDGRTQVHRLSCRFIVKKGHFGCGCPTHLSYKTVDSYIGKLRAIFHAMGRDSEWDKRLGLGNPAVDKSLKDHLRLITAGQLQARMDKLSQLALHLDSEMNKAKRNIDRFIIVRDQAYHKMAFFSEDRPSDLGQIKVAEMLRFPQNDGFLFNHIWGKTLRGGDGNVFGVRRNPQLEICQIRGAELSEIMDHIGWSNRHTALFYMQLEKVLNPAGASARLASKSHVREYKPIWVFGCPLGDWWVGLGQRTSMASDYGFFATKSSTNDTNSSSNDTNSSVSIVTSSRRRIVRQRLTIQILLATLLVFVALFVWQLATNLTRQKLVIGGWCKRGDWWVGLGQRTSMAPDYGFFATKSSTNDTSSSSNDTNSSVSIVTSSRRRIVRQRLTIQILLATLLVFVALFVWQLATNLTRQKFDGAAFRKDLKLVPCDTIEKCTTIDEMVDCFEKCTTIDEMVDCIEKCTTIDEMVDCFEKCTTIDEMVDCFEKCTTIDEMVDCFEKCTTIDEMVDCFEKCRTIDKLF